MQFSKKIKRLYDLFREEKNVPLQKITIPYGRHTYGPQPEILGDMPWVQRKAVGSQVGNFCSIAPGLRFAFLGKHCYQWVSTYPFYAFYDEWKNENKFYNKGIVNEDEIMPNPIIIENDVWIASNVTIKEGVKISNGAVIAMESLVVKDVPPYALVGGNPAKVIKYRFSKEQIEECLRIAWWNWTDEKIKSIVPFLLSEDIDKFIKYAKDY